MKLKKYRKIFIAGHNGMVGSAIHRFAIANNLGKKILTINKNKLNLLNKKKTFNYLKKNKPDIVFICSAQVGGIVANNQFPVDFLLNNLEIQNNLISGSYQAGIKKIIFLGSSCIYPREYFKNKKFFDEEDMLTGKLELTNEPYAISKIAGIKLCESFNRQYGTKYRSIIPCNLYGPNDNYDLINSHVIPALLKKFTDAKKKNLNKVKIWGTGKVKREFLHVDDLARAAFYLSSISEKEYKKLTKDQQSFLNVGYGKEISILELCELIASILNYDGKLIFDKSKPDGTKSKLINSNKIKKLGWKPEIPLKDGLKSILKDFISL